VRTSSSWISYSMWKCERHIPTSKMYPAIFDRCPMCRYPRPDEEFRPPLFPLIEKEEETPKAAPVVVAKVETPAKEAPPPTVTWDEDPEPELDEEPLSEPTEAEEEPATKTVAVEEEVRPKSVEKPMCPGPKCRKVSRKTSPYCSKICSDRCLRLRKKFSQTTLTEQEARWLNKILMALATWGWNRDKG
jgi:hypothetical protein